MNTSKQINIIVALVFAAVLATGIYTFWDPSRASDAKDTQKEKTIEYGAYLFAQNCIVCHGNKGEGGAAANRLKLAPPLNRPDLQGKDAKTGAVSATDKSQQIKFVINTLTCGRVGKAMPTWGQAQGGTLNDNQIRQLATLITEGTGWDSVDEFAVRGNEKYHIPGYDSDHMKLAQPLDAASTNVFLNLIDPLGKGSRIEIEGEIMSVTANPDKDQKSITVERGVGTTSPKAHAVDVEVLKPPVPPDPPSITQPACGQNLPPPVTPGSAVAAVPSATLTIIGQGTAFSTDKLAALTGVPLTLTFDNKDAGIAHNIHFYKGADETGAEVASTDIAPGPVTQTLNFGPLEAGDYFYRCDVHPAQMIGTLTASAAGAAPATGAPAAGTGTAVAGPTVAGGAGASTIVEGSPVVGGAGAPVGGTPVVGGATADAGSTRTTGTATTTP